MRRLLLAALCAGASVRLSAQQVQVIRPDSLRRADSLRARADSIRDTTVGKGRGLPRQPSRSFPAPDSTMRELMALKGFRMLHYAGDSVEMLAEERQVHLSGKALAAREGSTLESDTIRYDEPHCTVYASGAPHLFDTTGVVIGEGMQYDACNKTGLVARAKTDLAANGATWYVQGHMAFDNADDKVFAAGATMTSCELPDPHYHFAARQIKWVNKQLMVARPAVLYVEDVPVAWLPFVFQDTRHGRRSGILSPGFGINDIVRINPGYQRQITNIGYYWALSDYADAQVSLDWYSNRSLTLNGRIRYRWLDRFLAGGLAYQELHQDDGLTSRRISWSHQQQFSLNSQLTANIDYATSSQIISRNAVDPVLAIGTIDSRLNYQTRTAWGQLNVGGSRTQSLDRPQVAATFPSISFSPNPIAISGSIVWTPSLTFTNSIIQQGGSPVAVQTGPTAFDSLLTNSRNSAFSLSSPLRIGTWTLPLQFNVSDQWSNARSTVFDSTTRALRTYGEQFSTTFDWNTGIGLPIAFQGSWNLSPSISMVNTAGGPYAIRNQFTGGRFVTQGKRFQFSVGSSPTLFALLPGIGPVARIRHAISPFISWAYAPAADLPEDFARASNQGNIPAAGLRQPARQTVSFGLSQIFEAKLRPPPRPPGDTTRRDTTRAAGEAGAPEEGRKLKLLSVQSDAIAYDFEQAKLPGRTGWATQAWGNTLSSDLLRGFSLHISHDLWDGPVGYDTTRFSPYLTSVAFGVSLGASTLNIFRSLLGLSAGRPPAPERPDSAALQPQSPTNPGAQFTNAFQQGPLATAFSSVDRMNVNRGTPFQAQLSYSLQRSRPVAGQPAPTTNSMVSGSVTFSPTAHWTVSWQTSYNFTQGVFSDHVVRLDRDLHDWRATFAFVKSPNGNFAFNFNIVLVPEPDLKVGYDQRTLK